jgi:hypothetical protein
VNEVEHLGQLAGMWSAYGWPVLASFLALVLLACGAVALGHEVAVALRSRRRDRREARGPDPGPLAPLVARASWIPRDGELRPAEEQAFAVIAQRFRDGSRQRMSARAIGPVRGIRLARRARTRTRAARR